MADPGPVEFVIEPLGPSHDRNSFNCGTAALNTYLQEQARRDMDRKVAVVYVLRPSDKRSEIAGFYTLSATSLKLGDLPGDIIKRLPKYPAIPATLVGRLATSLNYRGQRLGERLLVDALQRSLGNSESVASFAVIVDAKDESSAGFYEKYGFTRLVDSPFRFFMTMKSMAANFV